MNKKVCFLVAILILSIFSGCISEKKERISEEEYSEVLDTFITSMNTIIMNDLVVPIPEEKDGWEFYWLDVNPFKKAEGKKCSCNSTLDIIRHNLKMHTIESGSFKNTTLEPYKNKGEIGDSVSEECRLELKLIYPESINDIQYNGKSVYFMMNDEDINIMEKKIQEQRIVKKYYPNHKINVSCYVSYTITLPYHGYYPHKLKIYATFIEYPKKAKLTIDDETYIVEILPNGNLKVIDHE